MPTGKALTVMYNKRILCIAFIDAEDDRFFDLGDVSP
jgi:hypothetical protein